MISQDVYLLPKTLEIQLREAAQDNEGIKDVCYDAAADWKLGRDLCSAIVWDSASYNRTAWNSLQDYYRLASSIFDPIHKIFGGM